MRDQVTAPFHSAASVIAAIQALPADERRRLFQHLEVVRDWQLGYVMVPVQILAGLRNINKIRGDVIAELLGKTVKAGNEAYQTRTELSRFHRGSQTMKARGEELLNAIRAAIETGTPRQPAAILRALSKREDADSLNRTSARAERYAAISYTAVSNGNTL
jgi:hypothetical protein